MFEHSRSRNRHLLPKCSPPYLKQRRVPSTPKPKPKIKSIHDSTLATTTRYVTPYLHDEPIFSCPSFPSFESCPQSSYPPISLNRFPSRVKSGRGKQSACAPTHTHIFRYKSTADVLGYRPYPAHSRYTARTLKTPLIGDRCDFSITQGRGAITTKEHLSHPPPQTRKKCPSTISPNSPIRKSHRKSM